SSMEMIKIEKVVVGRKNNTCEPLHTCKLSLSALGRLLSFCDADRAESLQCFQCFITFSDSKSKERHMRKSHREQYMQHLQQTNTLFICYKCDKCFFCPKELSQHQVTHTADEKPFVCTYCQKPFSIFSEFTRHRRYECALRGRFCKDCGASFPSPSGLRTHRKATHLGHLDKGSGDGARCCKCNRCFPTEEELLQHQEICARFVNCDANPQDKEQSQKPKCGINDEELNVEKVEQRGGAAKWERSRESSTDGPTSVELNIPCPAADCDCTFPSVEALRTHKKTKHGPPLQTGICSECNCPNCGKTLAGQSALKSHQALHCEVKKR
uniref:C2H2-type domain-containing protein n=1 Tax=Oryzias sinensis TaxID=183150 RepID=A0A8C7X4W1_9TELE